MNQQADDVYARVTNRIVEMIEQGAGRFQMPWHVSPEHAGLPANASSKQPYRGVNVLLLWAAAQDKQYQTGLWATYKQWNELGAQVRKKEKACPVIFWKVYEPGDKAAPQATAAEQKDKENRKRMVARTYHVFNADQVAGFTYSPPPKVDSTIQLDEASRFLLGLGAEVQWGSPQASYSPERDRIDMPHQAAFESHHGFCSVLAHELTHWTGHPTRLARDLSTRFRSQSYAAEELVGELGSAFQMAKLGLAVEPRRNHAAYIESWLKLLKDDSRAIFTAAQKAQQAVEWMHLQRERIQQQEGLAVAPTSKPEPLVEVWHAQSDRSKHQFPGDFDHVASVRTADLNEALRLTKWTDIEPWWTNAKVILHKESRSTAVGDVLVTPKGTPYQCHDTKWVKIQERQQQVALEQDSERGR